MYAQAPCVGSLLASSSAKQRRGTAGGTRRLRRGASRAGLKLSHQRGLREWRAPSLSRRVGKVVGYPPLSDMSDLQRREFHESLLEADTFEDLPGKWQAAIVTQSRTGRSCGSSLPNSDSPPLGLHGWPRVPHARGREALARRFLRVRDGLRSPPSVLSPLQALVCVRVRHVLDRRLSHRRHGCSHAVILPTLEVGEVAGR